MTLANESVLAALILRLLLNGTPESASEDKHDWACLLQIAARNTVLVRVWERMQALGWAPPRFVAAAVVAERRRNQAMLELIGRITRVCTARGISFVFLKALRDYPDAGDDVDLLVLSGHAQVDSEFVKELGAWRVKRNFTNWIAGATVYAIDGQGPILDVHHGRLGNLGEDSRYPRILWENSRRIEMQGTSFPVPSREDHLILQGMHRVYGRQYIKLSEIVYTISVLRQNGLDWDGLLRTIHHLGIAHGFGAYLGYVEQIYATVFHGRLCPPNVGKALVLDGWGRVQFRNGYYRFPRISVTGRLYLKKLQAALTSGNWGGAARLCLLPIAAGAAAIARLTGRSAVGPARGPKDHASMVGHIRGTAAHANPHGSRPQRERSL